MILIFFGLPATGKTYLSEKAAKEFDAVHLNTDIIRKKINLQGEYDSKSKQIVYDHLLQEMVNFVRKNQNVIVDGTFQKEKNRKQFSLEAKKLKQKLYFIELRANEETVRERMKSDRKHSEADFKVYQKIKRSFEDMSEPHLILSTDSDQTANELINKIKSHINE